MALSVPVLAIDRSDLNECLSHTSTTISMNYYSIRVVSSVKEIRSNGSIGLVISPRLRTSTSAELGLCGDLPTVLAQSFFTYSPPRRIYRGYNSTESHSRSNVVVSFIFVQFATARKLKAFRRVGK